MTSDNIYMLLTLSLTVDRFKLIYISQRKIGFVDYCLIDYIFVAFHVSKTETTHSA